MKPSKLHYLAGDTNIDELQYTQIYIKKSIDNYSKQNGVDVIPTSAIINDLSQNELINTSTLDFHGIAIPNYRYSPDQEAYIKQEGINSSLSFIDSNIIGISDYNEKTTITKIKRWKIPN